MGNASTSTPRPSSMNGPTYLHTNLWRGFFFKRRSLDLLPADIIIDGIMSYLNVKDILCLRMASKHLFILTRQPALWKRFLPLLPRLEYPIATLPPSMKYSGNSLSAIEIENMVTTAISLDNNWLSKEPSPFRLRSYETYHQTLSMVLLPGGHFMVASVLNRGGQYGIMVWAMDHPRTSTPIPIAVRFTRVKAYNLQARYMTVRGRKGIAISYLRKQHKENWDSRDIPETVEMGGPPDPEDPYMPLKYDCTTLHISLQALDALTSRQYKPGTPEFADVARNQGDALTVVSKIRTGGQLGVISLAEVDKDAYIAVVKRPDGIIIENLSSNSRTTIKCLASFLYSERPHTIWNIKILPTQQQILVLRTVERPKYQLCSTHTFEIFPFPVSFSGQTVPTACFDAMRVITEGFANMQIADLPATPLSDESLWPSLCVDKPPPPISIYCRMECDRSTIVHYHIWPIPVRKEVSRKPSGYIYQLGATKRQRMYNSSPAQGYMAPGVGSPRVLVGTSRAIVYTVPTDCTAIAPPVLGLYAYASREVGAYITSSGEVFDGNEDVLSDAEEEDDAEWDDFDDDLGGGAYNPVWPTPRKEKRRRIAPLGVLPPLAEQLRRGVAALAWDEAAGLLLAATSQDTQLHITDYAWRRKRDATDTSFEAGIDKPLAGGHMQDEAINTDQ